MDIYIYSRKLPFTKKSYSYKITKLFAYIYYKRYLHFIVSAMKTLDHKFLKPSNDLSVINHIAKNSYDYDNLFVGNGLKSRKVFLSLFNFNQIPPIAGIILSNKAGISILTYEYYGNNKNGYGPIEKYLNEDQDDLLDFISMYLSSLIGFAENVKIENLRYVGIGGSNIKIYILK